MHLIDFLYNEYARKREEKNLIINVKIFKKKKIHNAACDRCNLINYIVRVFFFFFIINTINSENKCLSHE